MHSLGRTLLVFALLHSVLQGQICLFLQVFIDFLLLHSSSLDWNNEKDIFWGVLVLEALVDLHRTIQRQLLQHRLCWDIELDYCDIEWFALEMNRDHSVVFESASMYCHSDSVDYDDCSISCKAKKIGH